jgi:hypothetical protein
MRQRDERSVPRAHLDPPALEREVEPARPWIRRGRNQLAIVAASLAVIAASSGLVWLQVARMRAAQPLSPLAAAEPLSTPVELPTAALAADDPIGAPVTGDITDDADGWRGVAASPDQFGVVALWSERTVWVSRDDGRSFRQELAAPEAIGAVTVGEDGRVYAARHGGRLGLLTPGGHTRWLRLDYDQSLAIAQGGTWIVLLAMSRDRQLGLAPILWVTPDHGASWRRLVAPAAGDLDNRLRVAADGSIDLLVRATGDLAPRIRHFRGHVDGRPFSALLDSEDPQPFGLGHDGSTARLVVERADRAHLEPYGLFVVDWDIVLGTGPDHTLAVADRRLLALSGTRAAPLSGRVPGHVRALAGDGIGRTVAIIGRVALRHSPTHGWRRLFERPAAEPQPP